MKFVKSVGYDDAFNYKTETVGEALTRLAPNGVDCYFDNVGSEIHRRYDSQLSVLQYFGTEIM